MNIITLFKSYRTFTSTIHKFIIKLIFLLRSGCWFMALIIVNYTIHLLGYVFEIILILPCWIYLFLLISQYLRVWRIHPKSFLYYWTFVVFVIILFVIIKFLNNYLVVSIWDLRLSLLFLWLLPLSHHFFVRTILWQILCLFCRIFQAGKIVLVYSISGFKKLLVSCCISI